mgnify:CR=1 FL=1
MAILSSVERKAVFAQWMREALGPCAILKTDLQAAVDAADNWVEANAGAYNAALPLPARTSLTARQKAAILTAVIRRRYEVI